MAVASVEKLQVFTLSSGKEEMIAALQESGAVHLEEVSIEELKKQAAPADLSRWDYPLYRLKHAIEVFADFDETKGFKRAFRQKPLLKPGDAAEALRTDYPPVLESLEKLESRRNELSSDLRLLEKEGEFLAPLRNLALPVLSVKTTDSVEPALGFLPLTEMEKLRALSDEQALWFDVLSDDKKNVHILLLYLIKEKDIIETALKELKVSLIFLDPFQKKAAPGDTVEDLLRKIEADKNSSSKAVESVNQEIKALAANRERLMSVYDSLANEREKAAASRLLGSTDRVTYLEGWIQASGKDRFLKKMSRFSDTAEFIFRKPFPEEDPPVVLENPGAARPFEVLTRLYGLPERGYFDPTRALAPFFVIYVGLMVSEAGYGLVAALLSLIFLKFAKPKGETRLFMKLLLILGVSNIIFGTFFGGWFGFPVRSLLIIDPLKDPISFLGIALGIGFIQVLFAVFLDMLRGIKNKENFQPIVTQAGWLVLLPSLTLGLVLKMQVFKFLAMASAAVIVLFGAPSRNPVGRVLGGLYKLYDISGYLADTLSYSRILALGLSTGVIAMVINNLCQTALRIPVVGYVLAPLIFVGGHLFNMGIGFLGGFVHSMRLQFVEFFRRFYKGGGRAFKPFRLEGKYVEFSGNP